MEEETANNNVNEDNDSVSSTEETNLDDLSHEELAALYKREREAKQEAVRRMREQETKHAQQQEQPIQTQEEDEDDEEDGIAPSVREALREEARAIVREEQQKARVDQYSKGSTEWLKEQSWSASLFGESEQSDKLYAQYSTELNRLSTNTPVHSQEEYKELMRLAVVNVTRKPDALLDNNVERNIQEDKAATPGYRGSSGVVSSENYSKLSDIERTMINRANKLRSNVGKPPVKQSDILNK